MSSYAYRTKERTQNTLVFATDATSQDKGIRFFCPNPECDAHMFLCNHNQINKEQKPYFRATLKEHRHTENCSYAVISFDSEEHDESKFDFDKATKRVMKPSENGKEIEEKLAKDNDKLLPPHTIKQIYSMAKNFPIDYTYNGIYIWKVLADERSRKKYFKGIFRNCLVEAKFAGFVKADKYIRLKYIVSDHNYHYLKLQFTDEILFHDVIKEILAFYQNSPIVIWGKWKTKGNIFVTDVYSKNQLYIPNHEKRIEKKKETE